MQPDSAANKTYGPQRRAWSTGRVLAGRLGLSRRAVIGRLDFCLQYPARGVPAAAIARYATQGVGKPQKATIQA